MRGLANLLGRKERTNVQRPRKEVIGRSWSADSEVEEQSVPFNSMTKKESCTWGGSQKAGLKKPQKKTSVPKGGETCARKGRAKEKKLVSDGENWRKSRSVQDV